jgi:hypothetical protein
VINVSAKNVVRVFAGIRVAIGLGFALPPDRLNGGSAGRAGDTLMTQSFAVREIVLGIGGLVATTRADASPSAVRMWAGLGALTDGGDVATALGGVRRGEQTVIPAAVAAAGLVAELWALRASRGNFVDLMRQLSNPPNVSES